MVGNYIFTNNVSSGYASSGFAENYSWVQVDNNAARPLYAQASYITNFDGLIVSLTAGNVNIGDVHIADPTTGLHANVVGVGVATGALRVLSQDLEPVHDTVSLADINGNNVKVNSSLSALNVYNTNNVTSLSAYIINPQIEISNDSGNPVPVTITNSISTTPVVGTQLVTYADSVQLDGNHRLRVSLPSQSWWYVSSVDKDGDLRIIESLTNGASSLYVQNLASATITSGTSPTGSAIRASRRRFKVRPGVSHQWTGTVNFDGQDIGTVKRLGMFTNFNGMFFELSGTDFNVVVRRRLTDGTLYEERVNRNNFNNDKLDGTGLSTMNWSNVLSGNLTAGTARWPITIGATTVYNAEFTYTNSALSAIKAGSKATIQGVTPSGYNQCVGIAAINTSTNKLTATYVFDPSNSAPSFSNATIVNTPYHNAHTFFFEFNGGRTAEVHFGLNSKAGPTYLHTFDFANQLGLQYENAPALMERKEIFNYQTMNYIPSMTIDGTAFTIEAESELNPSFVAAYNVNPITLVAGKDQPILGVGLRTGEPYQRSDMQIQQMNIIDTGNQSNQNNSSTSVIQWKLMFNAGLSNVPAPTNIGKSSRQWAYTSTTAITSQGIELMSGFAVSQSPIEVKTALNFLNMGSNIDYSDADKIILTARLISAGSNTSTVVASLNAIEAL
jgi:hypothetical protein